MNQSDVKVEKLIPETYDIDFIRRGGRYHCMSCGFISVYELDLETEYLDLHCKCGAPVIRVFPDEIFLGE